MQLALPVNTGRTRNNGGYDPLPYKDLGYAKVARNVSEQPLSSSSKCRTFKQPGGISKRILRPRYLCFLDQTHPDTNELYAIMTRPVEEWVASNPEKDLEYLICCFTSEQFDISSSS